MTQATPLDWPQGWPRTPDHRRLSRYQLKASFGTARDKLYGELRRLGATSVVVSCNLSLNRDGTHNAAAADTLISDPGIAVYFELKGRPMTMASDRYQTVAANTRSVGLAVEYLRGLERHGGGHMMERAFSGFSALPPPDKPYVVDERPWREVFDIPPGIEALGSADTLAIVERRYREAAKSAHSDTGGDDSKMIILNAAIAAARAELSK